MARLGNWADKIKGRIDDVVRETAQRTVSIAQTTVSEGGRMPVQTGFLRNSITAGGQSGQLGYVLAIQSFRVGTTLEVRWGAEYALAVEHGSNGRPGRLFMNSAADQWQQTFREVVREVARS